MSVNSDNQLKFDEGKTTEPLTIIKAGIEDFPFGNATVIHIKQTIEGYDHFLPSAGLEKKIKDENVDVGDVITIEKVEKSEKYPYGYFSVKVIEKNNIAPQHESVEKFEKQFEPNGDKMGLHELTLRVENLEKVVTVLSSEAGHKPGDEKISF